MEWVTLERERGSNTTDIHRNGFDKDHCVDSRIRHRCFHFSVMILLEPD
jgi:hypothetical protein